MSLAARIQLSAMMFLQFFIWGSWYVTMGSYLAANLGASGAQGAPALFDAVVGRHPRAFRRRADRRQVRQRRAAAGRHPPGRRRADVPLFRARQFDDFYPYLLGYMILYMPTLALVNSISFRAMDDPSRHFSKIRVWGTVGWIAAGLLISYGFACGFAGGPGGRAAAQHLPDVLGGLAAARPVQLHAAADAAQGIRRSGRASGRFSASDALTLLRDRNFLVFSSPRS